jgi:two-component sensor histidine kinase
VEIKRGDDLPELFPTMQAAQKPGKDELGKMPEKDEEAAQIEMLVATPDLADALETEKFRHFLDKVPVEIAVSEMKDPECIIYVNQEFENLFHQPAGEVERKPWSVLRGHGEDRNTGRNLDEAVVESSDFVGIFRVKGAGRDLALVDAYSNIIENDDATPVFRLVAFVEAHAEDVNEELAERLREKDTALLEIQHRVKNNLQMITALIRIEARNARGRFETTAFDRLAGRLEALGLVYKLLSDHGQGDEIDLGVYLSEIASSVMHAHAVEGIRLDLKVDAYPVSVNVAMPTGLVVNELLINALKYAFVGRDGGTITLNSSLVDSDGCRVVIADDGIGLPDGVEWPRPGKLGALIVRSLRENARATLKVESSRGKGTRVTILFTRSAAAPEQATITE